MSAPRRGLGAGGRLGLCWQSRDVRIQTSCHNIQIKHRSRQPPCEAEARRRPAEAEAGRQQPLQVPAKPPRWHGDADGGRLFESDDPPRPRPGYPQEAPRGPAVFRKKTRPNGSGGNVQREETSRQISRWRRPTLPESPFLPWWRGRPGAWWHSRRPAGFKECGKRQRRLKEPQSGREGGGLVEGVSLETQRGNATPP